ncbi:MAG: glycosyl hydrolase-related protein, partial [bacterium]
VNNSRVRVMAVKRAEKDDEVIVRLVETDGKPEQDVRIVFAGPVAEAREVDGQERPLGSAVVSQGEVVTNFNPYQIQSIAVKLAAARTRLTPPESRPAALAYERSVATHDGTPSAPGFDAEGQSLPAELLPSELAYDGIAFHLAPAETGKPGAVVAHGQTIPLPSGRFNRIYVLAASADGDRKAVFRAGGREADLNIEDWGGYVGQWDNRGWYKTEVQFQPRRLRPGIRPGSPEAARFLRPRTRTVLEFNGVITPGFIKRAPIAWFASHRHAKDGANEPYSYSYLFAYAIDAPEGAKTLTLPDDSTIRILAVTAAKQNPEIRPAAPLYDTLERSEPTTVRAAR